MPFKKSVICASLPEHQSMTRVEESSLKFTYSFVLDETICPFYKKEVAYYLNKTSLVTKFKYKFLC